MQESCVFCKSDHPFSPHSGYVVYEDSLVVASHMVDSDGDSYLGHLVLQTKRHARDFSELTDDEARAVGLAITRLSWGLRHCTDAENVYEIFFAEVVPHLHILMTARYPNTPEEFWRMNILDWPDAPRGDADAVLKLCRKLQRVARGGPSG